MADRAANHPEPSLWVRRTTKILGYVCTSTRHKSPETICVAGSMNAEAWNNPNKVHRLVGKCTTTKMQATEIPANLKKPLDNPYAVKMCRCMAFTISGQCKEPGIPIALEPNGESSFHPICANHFLRPFPFDPAAYTLAKAPKEARQIYAYCIKCRSVLPGESFKHFFTSRTCEDCQGVPDEAIADVAASPGAASPNPSQLPAPLGPDEVGAEVAASPGTASQNPSKHPAPLGPRQNTRLHLSSEGASGGQASRSRPASDSGRAQVRPRFDQQSRTPASTVESASVLGSAALPAGFVQGYFWAPTAQQTRSRPAPAVRPSLHVASSNAPGILDDVPRLAPIPTPTQRYAPQQLVQRPVQSLGRQVPQHTQGNQQQGAGPQPQQSLPSWHSGQQQGAWQYGQEGQYGSQQWVGGYYHPEQQYAVPTYDASQLPAVHAGQQQGPGQYSQYGPQQWVGGYYQPVQQYGVPTHDAPQLPSVHPGQQQGTEQYGQYGPQGWVGGFYQPVQQYGQVVQHGPQQRVGGYVPPGLQYAGPTHDVPQQPFPLLGQQQGDGQFAQQYGQPYGSQHAAGQYLQQQVPPYVPQQGVGQYPQQGARPDHHQKLQLARAPFGAQVADLPQQDRVGRLNPAPRPDDWIREPGGMPDYFNPKNDDEGGRQAGRHHGPDQAEQGRGSAGQGEGGD